MTQYLEKLLAKQCIADLLSAGYAVSVNDGEEVTLERSKDPGAIFAAMFTTDEDYLLAARDGETEHCGWVRFVYGNDGWDVINDYTVNLEDTLAKTHALSKEMEG